MYNNVDGGWSSIVPTQNLVDMYEMTDGKTKEEMCIRDSYNMTEFAIELPFENILLRIAVHNDKRRTGSSLETPLFVTSVRRIVQVGQ